MATEKKTEAKTPKAKVIKIKLSEDEKANAFLAEGRREEYTVKANELGTVHVELEQVDIDRTSMKKKSKPYVQIFDPRAWNMFRSNAKKLGFTHVRVLYAPEGTNIEVLDPVTNETKKTAK